MSPEQIVHSTLSADGAVAALVGDRIYPDEVPQDKPLPAVVYRRVGTQPSFTLDDTLAATNATIRLSCWAQSRLSAEQIADAAQSALINQQCMPVGRDGFTDPETGEEAALLDIEVWT